MDGHTDRWIECLNNGPTDRQMDRMFKQWTDGKTVRQTAS